MSKIRIVAVDDHQLILEALTDNVNSQVDMELIATGRSGEQVLSLLQQHKPDVLLLDQRLPQFDEPEPRQWFRVLPSIKVIRRQFPEVRIVIFSASAEPIMVRQAVEAGVSGYVCKYDDSNALLEGIRSVTHGELFLSEEASRAYVRYAKAPLTRRQIEVLAAIKRNPTANYAALAADLHMAESTFKKHLTSGMRNLGTPGNRLAAVQLGQELGLF